MPVCPTGASYKRKEDGIVLVDYDKCIGCKYCAWACPYGARELDEERQVMTKCTLCVDRIYDASLAAGGPQARLREGVPDRRAALRRRQGPRLGGLEGDPRARRLCADARVGNAAGQPVPAAARHAGAMNPAFSVIFFTTAAGAGQGWSSRSRWRCWPALPSTRRLSARPARRDGPARGRARPRRSFTSAGRSARGARRRCGARRGCRAR